LQCNANQFRHRHDYGAKAGPGLRQASTSRPGNLSGFCRGRRGPREGCEAKVFSAVRAKHDSVRHLLESRCAAATSEVFEALRHRVSRSIEEADVIEREVSARFSAPSNSFLGVHGKLGNSHSLIYTRLEDLPATVREYCRRGPGLCHDAANAP
jgi:hypothetical protein